jgi:regulator of protease activity HflC (stomatin/prohibitin superfamily)
MKTNIMTLQPQKIITKDTVTLQIETVVYYRTVDPYKLVYKLGTNLH